jgi:two-component system CheB/CheR fusion protein
MWFLCDDTALHRRKDNKQSPVIENEGRFSHAESADALRDRCLALVSHELRQPLATIMMRVGALLKKTSAFGSKQVTDDLNAIRSAALRQTKIVSDLMELSRLRTGKIRLDPTLVNVGELVKAVVTTIAEDSPDRGVGVRIDDSCNHQCFVDPVRIEQIVSNLLQNAVKFTGIGGRIEVCVASAEGFTSVSVSDDGIGISQEFLPFVFSMFGQERRFDLVASEGLGIGLAVVKELAQAHGGRVAASSEGVGRGSTFTVWLPLANQTAHAALSPTIVSEPLRA